MVKYIDPGELDHWRNNHPDHLLIDVREDYEYEDFNLGGMNIPLDDVMAKVDSLPQDKDLLFCCKSGKRSAAIAYTITKKLHRENVYSLQGGMDGIQELKS